MRDPNSTFVTRTTALVSSFCLLALVGTSLEAAEPKSMDTYTWSAELVSFDRASNTATVEARMVSHSDKPTDFSALHEGDAAMLAWSGISTAAGVRVIEPGSSSSVDRMLLPIEYVAADEDQEHVTFRVKVPAKDADALANVKPGEYVTATSPQHPAGPQQAVLAIKPYGQGFADVED